MHGCEACLLRRSRPLCDKNPRAAHVSKRPNPRAAHVSKRPLFRRHRVKLYNYGSGLFCEDAGIIYRTDAWMLDALFTADDPIAKLRAALKVEERLPALPTTGLLAPIDKQEVWAAGVTYFKSREARMEEAQQAGGGRFYDRVYSAERP